MENLAFVYKIKFFLFNFSFGIKRSWSVCNWNTSHYYPCSPCPLPYTKTQPVRSFYYTWPSWSRVKSVCLLFCKARGQCANERTTYPPRFYSRTNESSLVWKKLLYQKTIFTLLATCLVVKHEYIISARTLLSHSWKITGTLCFLITHLEEKKESKFKFAWMLIKPSGHLVLQYICYLQRAYLGN